jgi:hypothetical protein
MHQTSLFQHISHSDLKFYLLLIQDTTACTVQTITHSNTYHNYIPDAYTGQNTRGTQILHKCLSINQPRCNDLFHKLDTRKHEELRIHRTVLTLNFRTAAVAPNPLYCNRTPDPAANITVCHIWRAGRRTRHWGRLNPQVMIWACLTPPILVKC